MLGSLRSKSFKIYFKIFLFVVGFYIRFCEILRPKADPWERTEQLPFSPQIGKIMYFCTYIILLVHGRKLISYQMVWAFRFA
jgi:hypothetical protein